MNKEIIATKEAPQAIGAYSQAVKVSDASSTVYLSGQIPLLPQTMEMIEGDFAEQTRQVFRNLSAVAQAAGGSLDDLVKLNLYLTDLSNFATLNEVMAEFFKEPYPARAAVGLSELPKGALVEADAVMAL